MIFGTLDNKLFELCRLRPTLYLTQIVEQLVVLLADGYGDSLLGTSHVYNLD